jgi:hypothetical protein
VPPLCLQQQQLDKIKNKAGYQINIRINPPEHFGVINCGTPVINTDVDPILLFLVLRHG